MSSEHIGDLGEFGLIAALTSRFPITGDVILGPGDDGAIVAAPDGRVVISTDMLVEGRHFRRDWSSAHDIGRKAAAQNFADIVAMGARPTALMVAFAVPADLPSQWALDLADGLAYECTLVGATVVGGDVVRSDVITLSVTALGDLDGREPITRSGARPGDLVAMAGRIGWAAAGLTVLSRGFRSPRALVDAHRVPAPPYVSARIAATSGATSMIDVSDGLVADAGHLASASSVVIALQTHLLVVDVPVAEAASAFNVDPLTWLLTGGDDHAILATFAPGAGLPEGFVLVGDVREGDPGVLVDGEPYAATGGWDHFSV